MLSAVWEDYIGALVEWLESAFEKAAVVGVEEDGLVNEAVEKLSHF